MKILRVVANMDPKTGGPCQGIRNSIPELELLGCQNEVVSLDEKSSNWMDPFPLHSLGLGKRPWCYHSDLLPWLRKHLPKFDVVLLHGLWLYPGLALHKAATLLRKPYFIYPHGMLDPWFQRANSRRSKAIRNWIYWKLIEHRVVRDAEGLLFTSEEERRLAALSFRPYKPARELTVGYGIATPPDSSPSARAAFLNRCQRTDPERPFLLFLGRIDVKKGVDLLLQGFERALKAHSIPLDLVIAGPGLDSPFGLEMLEKSKEVSRRLGQQGSIYFPGMLTGAAKWGSFYEAEAFILPSHQENFGIAVVEALACALPVLISDQVNISSEIETDGAGLRGPTTAEGVFGMLSQFFRLSEADREQMRMNAKACYLARYAAAPAAVRLFETLQTCLK